MAEKETNMITVYAYVLDTLADWEMGYVIAELKSGRFFKKDAERVTLKTVGYSTEPIMTMGGMKVAPDCVVGDIVAGGGVAGGGAGGAGGAGGGGGGGAAGSTSVLLLPGADTWADPRHGAILQKARELLDAGGTVCAICGATVALANAGFLDARPHTSNGPGFLDMFAPAYKGQGFYVDEPVVSDGNLITAGSTAGLPWAKEIIGRLGVFRPDTLEAWYAYFGTGKAECFFALMQTLQGGE